MGEALITRRGGQLEGFKKVGEATLKTSSSNGYLMIESTWNTSTISSMFTFKYNNGLTKSSGDILVRTSLGTNIADHPLVCIIRDQPGSTKLSEYGTFIFTDAIYNGHVADGDKFDIYRRIT